MRLLVQVRQAVCNDSRWLLVALVLSTHLEPFVPRLHSAAAQHQEAKHRQADESDSHLFHITANLSAVTAPLIPKSGDQPCGYVCGEYLNPAPMLGCFGVLKE